MSAGSALAAQGAAPSSVFEEPLPLLREEVREPLPERPAAREAARKEALRHNCISCLILAAQNGFGRDVEPFLALSRETWEEEILFDAVKDLPHGALQKEDADGRPMFERDARGEQLLAADGKPIPVVDPFG